MRNTKRSLAAVAIELPLAWERPSDLLMVR